MEENLRLLLAKIDALDQRSRLLVTAAALAVIGLLGSRLLVAPLAAKATQLEVEIANARSDIAKADADLQHLADAKKRQNWEFSLIDPNAQTRERIESLKKEIASLNERMGSDIGSLIKPTEMVSVLKEVLARETNLRLMRLESLESDAVVAPPDTGNEKPPSGGEPALYRHGFVLELEGDYLGSLNYLRTLEALPWRLLWDSVTLESAGYPLARMTLKVHTLSLQGHWMELGS